MAHNNDKKSAEAGFFAMWAFSKMRCYFDLTNGKTTLRDDAGVSVKNLDQAVEQAEAVIAEMEASGELYDLPGNWELSIRGEKGERLTTVPIL